MDILTKIVKLRIDVRLLGRGSFYLVQLLHESLRVLPNGRIVYIDILAEACMQNATSECCVTTFRLNSLTVIWAAAMFRAT